MNAKNLIKTTGDLREFLAMTIEDVASGDIDLDKATHITKLAAQVNESFVGLILALRLIFRLHQVSTKRYVNNRKEEKMQTFWSSIS